MQKGTLHNQVAAEHIEAAVVYRPFGQVSGDIYDFSTTSDGTFSAFFGDATGHGVGAAFMTMMVQTGLDSIGHDASEEDVLNHLHHLIYERTENQFVTGMLLRIGLGGEARYANAGHIPMVLLPGGCEGKEPRLVDNEGGMPLGIFKEPLPFEGSTLRLKPGDRLFLMSDGIIEWTEPEGEQFGFERLLTYLAAHRGEPLQALVDGMVAEATRFSGGLPCLDDLTLIGLQYR